MQGVQAQTVANFLLSFEANLSIIPVINKVREVESTCIPIKLYSYSRGDNFPIMQIDLPLADVERVMEQLHNAFGFSTEEALKVYLSEHTSVLSITDTSVMNASTCRC